MALKVRVYQAQGDLQAAAKLLVEINAETPSDSAFEAKLAQLTLERNHAEAVRLLEDRLAHVHFGSEIDRGFDQVVLAFAQHFAGDSASAKVTAQQARDTLEPLCKNQPDNFYFTETLALANAALGDKDSAIKEAERAIMLLPSAKDRVNGPGCEENLALIQAIFGENSRAISNLTRLLQTRSNGWHYDITPLTPALLRLDPIWDPLRADPAFQKLCEEKQP
jgi:serine/threonine-protein kinase